MRMETEETMVIRINPELSIRSQIAEHYRGLIRRGELRPGDRLPPARRLAAGLGIAEANVHHALGTLVREGLIVRRPRAGSIVIRQERGLRSVAFFIPWRSLMRGEEFTRLLTRFVTDRLEQLGIDCHVLYDTPGGTGRSTLKQLAADRRIQGVIFRTIEPDELKFYQSLSVPFTGIGSVRLNNRVSLITAELIEKMAGALRDSGCRSFGVLIPSRIRAEMLRTLRLRAAAFGLEFRDEWLFDGTHSREAFIVDRDAFAWKGVEYLNSLPERPEGLMLYSDDLVNGLTMAFYRYGVRVPEDYRLAIHHTRENPVLFPFECTLVQHSIAEIADALAGQLSDLCEGKPPRNSELSIAVRRCAEPQ